MSSVYLIAGPNGLYKIGQSHDPERRAKWIARKEYGVSVAATLAYSDATRWERYLHEAFAHRRVAGEWFRLTPEDAASLCSMIPLTDGAVPLWIVELHAANEKAEFAWGESGNVAPDTFDFLSRAPCGPKRTEPNVPMRVPASFAKRVKMLAIHHKQDPAEYVAERFAELLDEDEAEMLADMRRALSLKEAPR